MKSLTQSFLGTVSFWPDFQQPAWGSLGFLDVDMGEAHGGVDD